jgi:DNA invertase Pin-like site-specific DNA recombinase
MNVIGYVRVSADDQGRNGYGLDAQRSAIRAECDRRGWLAKPRIAYAALARRPD